MLERRRHVDLSGECLCSSSVGGGGQSRGSAIPRETETSMSWLSKMTFAAIDWPTGAGRIWQLLVHFTTVCT